MTRPSLWLAAGASLLVHAGLGWQLCSAPAAVRQEPERDTFQVRRVVLPPPAPEPSVEAPEPPAPPEPKPRPRPTPVRPAEPLAARPEPVPEPAPEVVSAPRALLADTPPAAVGGVVQLPGAAIGALVSTKPLLAATPPRNAAAVAAPAAALAKLSDLSRKPRAPSLDAALRQNYPAALRRRGTEGQAEVRVVIDARGRVGDVTVLSESAAGFAEACRRTLLGSRWSEPLDRDGNAVSTRLTYRCRFQIER